MKYDMEYVLKHVKENGNVVMNFFDDIDDISFDMEMSPEEALKELNETYGCYLV